MEKANVSIETARVSQGVLEVVAANESADLASLTATNSQQRLENYREFDNDMRAAEAGSFFGSFISSVASAAVTGLVNPAAAAGGLGGFFPPLVMGATYDPGGSDYLIGLILLSVTALLALLFTIFRLSSDRRPSG